MKKIAVPVRGNMVDEHFGHCEAFAVFQIDENHVITKQETVHAPQECGCRSNIAMDLASRGVTVLLAGGLGQGARNVLNHAGIEVYSGFSGKAEEAVYRFLKGETGDNSTCSQHQHHHGHEHGGHAHGCGHHA